MILLTVITGAACAQADALKALQKIANAYNSSTAIHFTASMKMYDKQMPAKVIDRMQSSYTVKNRNFSCSIGPVSMLLNDDYYVSADDNDKLIVIGRKKDLQASAGGPVLNLDQLKNRVVLNKIKAVLFVRTPVSILQLSDADGSSGFTACNIEFYAETGCMKKCILETVNYGNEAGKTTVLEINYTEPVKLSAGKYLFSERSFFSVVDNKIQLAARYKTYQVISQL